MMAHTHTHIMLTIVPPVLRHCWLGDKKGIWPVKISHQHPQNVLLWKIYVGPKLIWREVNLSTLSRDRQDSAVFSAISFMLSLQFSHASQGRTLDS